MTTDTRISMSDGDPLNPSYANTNWGLIDGDIVPRNASGVPTAAAGNLGTTTYPFGGIALSPTTTANSLSGFIDEYILNIPGTAWTRTAAAYFFATKSGTLKKIEHACIGGATNTLSAAVIRGTNTVCAFAITTTVSTLSGASITNTAIAVGDKLRVDITEAGTTTAGNDICVTIFMARG